MTLIASLALAFSLTTVAVPSAFAVITDGDIEANQAVLPVVYGDSISVAGQFHVEWTDPTGAVLNTDYHIDYQIDEDCDDMASVNKHNGTVTVNYSALLDENNQLVEDPVDITVNAYLIKAAKHGQGQGTHNSELCDAYADVASIIVRVSPTSVYTYQGIGGNAIMMNSPLVDDDDWSYNSSTNTYTNQLGTLTAVNGYYEFTYVTESGFNSYNTAAAYEAYEAGNIKLYRTTGNGGRNLFATLHMIWDEDLEEYVPGTDNNLVVSSVNASTKTVTLQIPTTALNANDAILVFEPSLVANSSSKTLGSTVEFVFNR